MVFSIRHPDPDFILMDMLLIHLSIQKIPGFIYFNKMDLDINGINKVYKRIYQLAGYEVFCGFLHNDETMDFLRKKLKGKTTILAGPSGVGKSSLTNRFGLKKQMKTGALSQRIMRGKQTTRHTELISLDTDSFLMDTPGFSSLDPLRLGIDVSNLKDFFDEFTPYAEKCRFTGCSHVYEESNICAVKEAVFSGKISRVRYENYCKIYRTLYLNRRK